MSQEYFHFVAALPEGAVKVEKYYKYTFENLFYCDGYFYKFQPKMNKYRQLIIGDSTTGALNFDHLQYHGKYVSACDTDKKYRRIYYKFYNQRDMNKYEFLKPQELGTYMRGFGPGGAFAVEL